MVRQGGRLLASGLLLPKGAAGGRLASFGFTRDGRRDRRYGFSGSSIQGSGPGLDPASAGVQTRDGSVVGATLRGERGGVNSGLAIARVDRDGRLDSDFGDTGFATAAFEGFIASLGAIAVQTDGKIVVAGSRISVADAAFPEREEIVLARYDSEGNLDRSFGEGGVATLDTGLVAGRPVDVAVRRDGRIVVGATLTTSQLTVATSLVTVLPDGSLDAGFGSRGVVRPQLGDRTMLGAIQLDRAGRILIAGGSRHLVVGRYLQSGLPDADFAGDGTARFSFSSRATDVLVDRRGRVVVAGVTSGPPRMRKRQRFAVGRLTPGGRLDRTFGERGRRIIGFSMSAYPSSLSLRRDGRIVIAGGRPPFTGDGTPLQRVFFAQLVGGGP